VLETHLSPLSGVSATESKYLAAAVSSAVLPSLILSQHPRTLVQLVIQSLCSYEAQWRDIMIASFINASTLAFLNAGSIPMRGVVCAVCVGRTSLLDGSSEYLVDPTRYEARSLDGSGCFAFLLQDASNASPGSLVWSSWHSGPSSVLADADAKQIHDLALHATTQLWHKMKELFKSPQIKRNNELDSYGAVDSEMEG
jgi:exosome complex component RRP46